MKIHVLAEKVQFFGVTGGASSWAEAPLLTQSPVPNGIVMQQHLSFAGKGFCFLKKLSFSLPQETSCLLYVPV